ncbi:MAG: hypothetical protein WBW56_17360, partial [Syntrophobacteraceae bacterium]
MWKKPKMTKRNLPHLFGPHTSIFVNVAGPRMEELMPLVRAGLNPPVNNPPFKILPHLKAVPETVNGNLWSL